jgi:hypothetical protein
MVRFLYRKPKKGLNDESSFMVVKNYIIINDEEYEFTI